MRAPGGFYIASSFAAAAVAASASLLGGYPGYYSGNHRYTLGSLALDGDPKKLAEQQIKAREQQISDLQGIPVSDVASEASVKMGSYKNDVGSLGRLDSVYTGAQAKSQQAAIKFRPQPAFKPDKDFG